MERKAATKLNLKLRPKVFLSKVVAPRILLSKVHVGGYAWLKAISVTSKVVNFSIAVSTFFCRSPKERERNNLFDLEIAIIRQIGLGVNWSEWVKSRQMI